MVASCAKTEEVAATAAETVTSVDIALTETISDTGPPDAVSALDPGVDTAPLPPPVFGPEARGLVVARGALHVHSVFSHDACDGHVDEVSVDAACEAEFIAQICTSGLDFIFLTDHPSNMSKHPFPALLHHDEKRGDTLVKSAAGDPYANVVHCKDGDGGLAAHDVVITVGFEGTHTMPVRLGKHLDPPELEKYALTDVNDLEKQKSVGAAVHAVDGVWLNAHSEEDEISAERLAALPLDGMELYNTHANFNVILKGGKLEKLFDLQAFLDGAPEPPAADLVLLSMLDVFPEPGIIKWYKVSAMRPITAVIGADVHQNVNLDGYCTPGGQYEALCDALAEQYPALVAALKKGGPLKLTDQKRIDSYERIFRWFHNRVYVTERSANAVADGIRKGRVMTVFTVFGEVANVDVHATEAGSIVEMGGQVSLAKSPKIVVRPPDPPVARPWSPFTADEAKSAVVTAKLMLVDKDGKTEVSAEFEAKPDALLTFGPDRPGRYHVEVMITPKHLSRALAGRKDLAEKSYRWLVTNPIYVAK